MRTRGTPNPHSEPSNETEGNFPLSCPGFDENSPVWTVIISTLRGISPVQIISIQENINPFSECNRIK